jgi:hypothetical protein
LNKIKNNYDHTNINIVEAISNSKWTNTIGYTKIKEDGQEEDQDQDGNKRAG